VIDLQNHLLYLADLIVKRNLESNKLRGVEVLWKDKEQTVCLYFYFDESPTEEDCEMAWDISAGIIASFPDGLLEGRFIDLDSSQLLPTSTFWAYKRDKEKCCRKHQV